MKLIDVICAMAIILLFVPLCTGKLIIANTLMEKIINTRASLYRSREDKILALKDEDSSVLLIHSEQNQ